MATCASDWHLTQLQVQSNLDQISLALDNAAVCYDDAETTNQGRFATPTPAPATGPAPPRHRPRVPGPWPAGRPVHDDVMGIDHLHSRHAPHAVLVAAGGVSARKAAGRPSRT